MVRITDKWKAAYYETEHWRRLRNDRISMDGNKCCWCNSSDELQVHHWQYELFSEAIADLMTLCRHCHSQIHAYRGMRVAFPKTVQRHLHERIGCDNGHHLASAHLRDTHDDGSP